MIEGLLIALVLVVVILLLISVDRAERLGAQHGRWIFDDPATRKLATPPGKGSPPHA